MGSVYREWRVGREDGRQRVCYRCRNGGGSGEHFLVDDDYDQQDENGDNGASYETLFVHPKIQRNLR